MDFTGFSKLCVLNLILLKLKGLYSYEKDSKCYKSTDLMIVLDASGSIELPYWTQEITLTKDIVKAFDIIGSLNRFAIVDFSTHSEVRVTFEQGNSYRPVSVILDTIKENFKDSHSMLDKALNTASEEFSKVSSSRDSIKVLVAVTDGYMTWRDGKQNDEFLSVPVNKLKALEVVTFAVGIGKYIKSQTLKYIATYPDETHIFKVTKISNLIEEIQKATQVPCNQATTESPTTTMAPLTTISTTATTESPTTTMAPLTTISTTAKPPNPSFKDCDVKFEKINGEEGDACFYDSGANPQPLPDLVLQDRDANNAESFSGVYIDWKNWNTYMPDFICRCAKKVKQKGRKVFGIQKYGECWTGERTDTYNIHGIKQDVKSCKSFEYKDCKNTDFYCVGANNHNFVYKLEE